MAKKRYIKELKDNMIKSIRNLFKLETENKPKDNIIKNMKNIFKLENGTKPIKDKIIADIGNLCEQEEDYYKTGTVDSLYSNNYIKYGSNGYRYKNLSIDQEFLNKSTKV